MAVTPSRGTALLGLLLAGCSCERASITEPFSPLAAVLGARTASNLEAAVPPTWARLATSPCVGTCTQQVPSSRKSAAVAFAGGAGSRGSAKRPGMFTAMRYPSEAAMLGCASRARALPDV